MVGSFGMSGSLISLDAVKAGNANIVAKVLNDDFCREKVDSILDSARDEVRAVLGEHAYLVEALRDALLEREELIGPEINEVLESAQASWDAQVLDLREDDPAFNPGRPV
jgi:ATP-dependent Zn protease